MGSPAFRPCDRAAGTGSPSAVPGGVGAGVSAPATAFGDLPAEDGPAPSTSFDMAGLLGPLYVLEGSTLGAQILYARAKALVTLAFIVAVMSFPRHEVIALAPYFLYPVALLARGKSNREIGVALFISETTVKSHLRNIFAKLNVLSRTEAITVASRRGLIQL